MNVVYKKNELRGKWEKKEEKNYCQRFLDVKSGNREKAEPKSSTLYVHLQRKLFNRNSILPFYFPIPVKR